MITTIDDDFNKEQYEQHLQSYLDLNKDGHVGGGTPESRVSVITQFLAPGSHVFEIGSGGGDDALALQAAGYKVTASDYSDKFVQVLASKGLDAMLLDAKTDTLPLTVDAVYANAVFVHFTPNEFKSFLLRLHAHLQNAKLLYFSVIHGQGLERRATTSTDSDLVRDFQYYTEEDLRQTLRKCAYEVLDMRVTDTKWIQVVAQLVEAGT